MIIEQKIGTLTRTSNTQVQLTGLSIVKLGGQFKSLTSPTLLTSVSGIGGLDTGAIAVSSFYYVYAVSTGSVEGLVCSLSAISPTGFLRFKKVGAFYTDGSANVSGATSFGERSVQGVRMNTLNASAPASAVAICKFDNITTQHGSGLFLMETDSTLGTRFTFYKKAIVSGFWAGAFGTAQQCGWSLNSNQLGTGIFTITAAHLVNFNVFGSSQSDQTAMEVVVGAGDVLRPHNSATGSRVGTPANYTLSLNAQEAEIDWKDY